MIVLTGFLPQLSPSYKIIFILDDEEATHPTVKKIGERLYGLRTLKMHDTFVRDV